MRILYLTDRLSQRGGADQHLLQVIGDSRARGDQVAVAHGRTDEDDLLPSGVHGIPVRGLASSATSEAGLSALAEPLAWAQVVHLNNVMNPVAIARAVDTGRAVITVQDHRAFCPGMGKTLPDGKRCERAMADHVCTVCLPDDEHRHRLLTLTRQRLDALRGARRVLVLSCYMARELEALGIPAVLVLPPWIEPGNTYPVPGSGFLLGGRLDAHKGIGEGWRAWREADTDSALRVVGEGPLQDQLEGAECLGWLNQATLAQELHGARALLFPSRWQEPFGMLGVQSLAQGTPVVVADSGGAEEWSTEGCLLVPAGDIAAMANAIERLDRDSTMAMALGEAGRASVAWRFDRAAITAELTMVYLGIAG